MGFLHVLSGSDINSVKVKIQMENKLWYFTAHIYDNIPQLYVYQLAIIVKHRDVVRNNLPATTFDTLENIHHDYGTI